MRGKTIKMFVHTENKTYTADSHPNNTKPRHRNNMNVYLNKNTEDSLKKETNVD